MFAVNINSLVNEEFLSIQAEENSGSFYKERLNDSLIILEQHDHKQKQQQNNQKSHFEEIQNSQEENEEENEDENEEQNDQNSEQLENNLEKSQEVTLNKENLQNLVNNQNLSMEFDEIDLKQQLIAIKEANRYQILQNSKDEIIKQLFL